MKRKNVRARQWKKHLRKSFRHHEWSRQFVVSKLNHDAIRPTSWWGNLFRY